MRVAATDYVQYHNADKHGRGPRTTGKKVGIYWTGKRSLPIGSRVWLVTGQTVKGVKRYSISFWFVVDELTEPEGEKNAFGLNRRVFSPPIDITTEQWLPAFLSYMGNFGRGLSPLRPEDVLRFEAACDSRTSSSNHVDEQPGRPTGAGFGSVDNNRKVEAAAIAFVTGAYQRQGWAVTSVEAEDRGYDLLCSKDRAERHVEVKGVSGDLSVVIIIVNELGKSKSDEHWVLAIVLRAVSGPELMEFNGSELGTRFSAVPIAYRLAPKVARVVGG
jgi:hypothetical protein